MGPRTATLPLGLFDKLSMNTRESVSGYVRGSPGDELVRGHVLSEDGFDPRFEGA